MTEMYHIDFDRLRREHDELMEKYDWLERMPRWRRLLLRLFRDKRVWYSHEDTHVFVRCECGEELSASDSWVTWCKCGRGYRTEMHVYKYPALLGKHD